MEANMFSVAKKFAEASTKSPDTTAVPQTTSVPVPSCLLRPIATKPTFLMGTGPTNFSQRVSEALCKPLMGLYMDETHYIMDEIKEGLRYIFQTKNSVTYCSSCSGNGGIESVLFNLVEEGDVVLFGVTGDFGRRAVNIGRLLGADVRVLEATLGTVLKYEQIRGHVELYRPKILYLVHGESSCGVLQSLVGLGDLCRRYDCLLVIDAVSTAGAVEFLVDEWKIDAAFAASQKVLGAPAGLAPITLSERAMQKIHNRKTPVKSYYWDAVLLSSKWGCQGESRMKHHTVSLMVLYGLRESLAEICEQGLESFRNRHSENAIRLQKGLQSMGLELFVQNPEERLPTITAVRIPYGVNWNKVSDYLLESFSLEVSSGFGRTEDMIFRIGLMNSNATYRRVDYVLNALREALRVTCNYAPPTGSVYY
ncbi:serine--pyruvate aminotransferase, mitochondrial-like [Bradysia coprophila]|uniref:serine--pyruvate aminotransferase, mitochondrial-like n=1 Tax=Bradysia coprophila TaxID=38358 RepID=UPI00187DA30E|nr:serine--pyruvate aminotransferase, mitochondrial-like [Bradysia coprophila]